MLNKCGHCRSADTQAQGDTYGCLSCGKSTDYEGNAREGRGAAGVVKPEPAKKAGKK